MAYVGPVFLWLSQPRSHLNPQLNQGLQQQLLEATENGLYGEPSLRLTGYDQAKNVVDRSRM